MPAFLSVAEFGLPAKYHLKAIGCEQQAERATDQATEPAWRELSLQWQSMADQAARLPDDARKAN
jgi:hypothetical protein